MRTYGRINGVWTEVLTDSNGSNSYVYLTTLIQTLKLNQGESPLYAQYGIPAYQSVMSQIAPNYASAKIQQQYSPYFASLTIAKDTTQTNTPTYSINATFLDGTTITQSVAT